MKLLNIILFALSLNLFACYSTKNAKGDSDSAIVIVDGTEKIVNEKYLVVPGRSVGEISLGDDMQEVFKILGKADAGDAAMGKAWNIWYSTDSTDGIRNEYAIYSAYRDSNMVVRSVKQIRITAPRFKTQDGFGTGRSFYNTQMKFPGLMFKKTYVNASKDTLQVYDSKSEGISFEFRNGKGVALTIHPKNTEVNDTYLTLHPEWKTIE